METKDKKVLMVKNPTVEDLKQAEKKTDEAKSTDDLANEVLKKIEEQQKRVVRLNQLFADRERFYGTQENLRRFSAEVAEAIKKTEFETPNFRIILAEGGKYDLSEVIKISHPEVVKDVLELLNAKVLSKIQQLNSAIVMAA